MKFSASISIVLLASLRLMAAENFFEPAGDKIYVLLRADARIATSQLRLGEVAEVSGFDEGLIAMLDSLPLGPAPLPGESQIISKMDIRRSLANHRIDPLRVAFTGEDSVTVTRTGRVVSHAEIKELVDKFIQSCWADEDVRTEILYTRLPEELALENENCTLTVLDPVKAQPSGALAVSAAAMDGDRVVARFPVSIKVRLWRNVIIMKNSLSQGDIVSPDDISFAELELTGQHSEFITAADDAIGMRIKRPVQTGQALTESHVERPPLVERGDEVLLVVKYKGITIRCQGKAWQKGHKGDRILVRNQYGKNLLGEVQDSHTVLVNP
ncbi:MAG TPA: flagellar basal body P-ring formation chaperone FlgA [Candidatus Glassbacteria bacterium]|nr:flagellar basal body P-ring formation chaperone FlgA [Candidatus Glassbacteria bacterium]